MLLLTVLSIHLNTIVAAGKTSLQFDEETQAMASKAGKMWSKWEKMTLWCNEGLTRAADAALSNAGDAQGNNG